jgi:hypothetical protein
MLIGDACVAFCRHRAGLLVMIENRLNIFVLA